MQTQNGQISVEYLIIIGVAIGVLVPSVLLFYSYSQAGAVESLSSQINLIGVNTIATAKETYALGTGARRSLEFSMPESVTSVTANGTELIIAYNTQFGISEAVFFSSINLTTGNPDGSISPVHPGLTKYRFVSQGQQVYINETS